jgi:hypothetical protein
LNCTIRTYKEAANCIGAKKKSRIFKDLIENKPEEDQFSSSGCGNESDNPELIQKILLVNKQLGQYSILKIHRF